jgi:hypothetical protein
MIKFTAKQFAVIEPETYLFYDFSKQKKAIKTVT